MFEPKLVLMDEPLGALDKQLREQMQYEIKHLHERLGVTVVYVTHDQSEALTMSDRIAVLDHGRDPAGGDAAASSTSGRRAPSSPSSSARTTGSLGTVRAVDGSTCVVEVEGGAVQALRGQRRRRRQPLDPVAAPRARADRSGPRTLPQPVRGARRGADLSRRPHPDARARLRLRRLHHQGAERRRPGAISRSARPITIGWRVEDCRALDVA